MSKESLDSLEEERRLFYVALTRAQKRAFITFADSRFRWGQFIECEPSRFIYEINNKYVEKRDINIQKKPMQKFNYSVNFKTKSENKSTTYLAKNNLKKINKNYSTANKNITKIKNGVMVKHSQFGKGKVLSIEGEGNNVKATVFFQGIGQKNLLLRFAKLEVI